MKIKLKKLLKRTLIMAMAVCLYGSCNEENLDLLPLSATETDFFTQELEFERGIRGVYAKMADWYVFNNNNPIHEFWHAPGDDITTVANYPFEIFGNLNPSVGEVSRYYGIAYQLVNRANTMLQKIGEEDGVYTTPNLKQYNTGEALFLRGYAFFQLWNWFGTSPLITERISGTDGITQPGSEGTQLLDQAIADLQEAAGLLPLSWDDANRGRITSNAANGMLGKALVFRGDYTGNTADYTTAIQAFSAIQGRSLMPNFGQNFSNLNENNEESLFESQASQTTGSDNVWLANDNFGGIGSISAYWGLYQNHWSLFGAAPLTATDKLLNAFEADDPRRALTINPDDASIVKYTREGAFQFTNTGVGTDNNPRILRYADVLLLRAEALIKSGGNASEAIDLINQIRTRARFSTEDGSEAAAPLNRPNGESNASTILEWIREERFLELAGEEGHRFLDLKRWNAVGDINIANWDFSSANPDFDFNESTHLLYPIPLSEIDLNPNVTQNPNY